jgi:DNA gyrase subunit A
MQRAYIDYSMSVIIGRALPDARDGLKPVQPAHPLRHARGRLEHSKPFVKCAQGGRRGHRQLPPARRRAVYDTLVRMAQDFSMRYPLIKGQGNFGSHRRRPARRLPVHRVQAGAQLAEEMLADIDKNTVDMQPNFDEQLQEPTVLPARVPNLLVNGSTGIAVGMATNIPPHNLGEVVDAACT